jgi:HEAT repeat protein
MRWSWTAAAWLAIGAIALAQPPATWEGKTVRQWIDRVTAQDLGTRWYAIYVLGQLGPQAADAVAPLENVLAKRSEQEYVRGTAAWALGRIGPAAARAVPLLIETMHSQGHISVRRNANEALGNLGAAAKPAVPELFKALSDEDAVTRVTAAVALWKIDGSDKALDALLDMLRRGKAPAPYCVAVALGTLGAAQEKTGSERSGAPRGYPVPVFSDALVEALGNADADVRRAAARSLGQIGPAALPALTKALDDPRDEVRRLAAEGLGWMGPAAVEPLTAALKNQSAAARRAAARALGRLGPAAKAAEADLVRAVNDPQAEVRAAAAAALVHIRADEPAEKEPSE